MIHNVGTHCPKVVRCCVWLQGHVKLLEIANSIDAKEVNAVAASVLSYISHYRNEEALLTEVGSDYAQSGYAKPGPTRMTSIVACVPAYVDASGQSTGRHASCYGAASVSCTGMQSVMLYPQEPITLVLVLHCLLACWNVSHITLLSRLCLCQYAHLTVHAWCIGGAAPMQRGASMTTSEHIDPSIAPANLADMEDSDEGDIPEGGVRFDITAEQIAVAIAAESLEVSASD